MVCLTFLSSAPTSFFKDHQRKSTGNLQIGTNVILYLVAMGIVNIICHLTKSSLVVYQFLWSESRKSRIKKSLDVLKFTEC